MKIIRGDTKDLKFQRKNANTGEIITDIPDNMYFTVKKSYKLVEFVFQKRLSDNTITYNEDDNYYYITIESTDTDNLPFGDYDYDIEVIENNKKKTIAIGTITIDKEVTYAVNEVNE
jgi:plasmid rolling circle replication initiator protein Rep